MIEEATGRADDDRRLRAEGTELVAVAAATSDGYDRRLQRGVEPGELLFDLLRELARRRDDDRPRLRALVFSFFIAVGRVVRRIGLDRFTDRKADRDRLSGAGLRAYPEIAASELRGKDGFLNGGEPFKSALFERSRELGSNGFCEGGIDGGQGVGTLHQTPDSIAPHVHTLDIGIIGCGTAGNAAAIFLARAGHAVTLYERVPVPTTVGAGITLQPTGLHALARLGLFDAVVGRGARIDRLLGMSRARKPIFDLHYRTIGEHLFGLGLHRGVLFEALYGAAHAEPNVTLRTATGIRSLRTGAGRTVLVDDAGEEHGPHDLVVVADGARSLLRSHGACRRAEGYPWGALWFVGKDLRPASDPLTRSLVQVMDGNRAFLGLLPTGQRPGSTDRLVSLFWSIRGDRIGAWRAQGLDAWKDEVRTLGPETAPVLDQIHDASDVLFASYHDVVMHRFHSRGVVYLGDAAHAMSPQLGQGCNLALWDAMELADSLASEPRDLGSALACYSRRRADHLAFYQVASRWLTPFFQGDTSELGVVRDLAMPWMGRVPLFERMMTLSMLGVVNGFAGQTLPLSLPQAAGQNERAQD